MSMSSSKIPQVEHRTLKGRLHFPNNLTIHISESNLTKKLKKKTLTKQKNETEEISV